MLTRETSVVGPQKEGDVWAGCWREFNFLRVPLSLFKIENLQSGNAVNTALGVR